MIVAGYHPRATDSKIKEAVESILNGTAMTPYRVDTPAGKMLMGGIAINSLLIMVKARTGVGLGKKDVAIEKLKGWGYDVWTCQKGLAQPITVITPRHRLRVVAGTDLQQTG